MVPSSPLLNLIPILVPVDNSIVSAVHQPLEHSGGSCLVEHLLGLPYSLSAFAMPQVLV